MRKLYFLLIAVIFCNLLQAQTVLIDPTTGGGFQSGTDFASNGWTVSNTTNANRWFLGTVPGGASFTSRAAYISSDPAGTTWTFTNSSPSVSHFYRDVTIPAGQTQVTLSFNWQALGETGFWDALIVSVAPTTYTPTGSATSLGTASLPAPATMVGSFWNNNTYQTATISIPQSVINNCTSASTVRIIFTWKNDTSGGSNPPAAVDNISLVSQVPVSRIPSTGGAFTIDNVLANTGTNFTTFTEAINSLNNASICGLTGPVTFNVTSTQSFSENVPAVNATGTSANPIIFQKSGAGANPQIKPTGTVATTDFGFRISGGDYITINGIDVSIASGSAVEYGYMIMNASATDGASNNTIKNVAITLNRSNTASVGIYQNIATTPTSTLGANSNNKFQNIQVYNSYNGILLSGSSTFNDSNNEIGTIDGGSTIIGAAYAGVPTGDIGGGTTASYGIQAASQSSVKISNVTVRNIASTPAVRGIYVTTAVGTSIISNNSVYGLRSTSATSTTGVNGFDLSLSTSVTGTLNVFNNFVYDLTSAYTGAASATRQLRGILLGSGIATSVYNVHFNSIRMDGSTSPNVSSVALELGGTTAINNIQNNILANFTGTQAGIAKHYTIRTTSATAFGGTGSILNHNLYYIDNTTNGFVGLANTTDLATLANLRTTFSQDASSKSSNPQFVSATDLHINPSVATEVESGGITVSGIAVDIDGQTRNTSTPDIGADEGAFTLLDATAPLITYSPLSFTCATGDRTLSGVTIFDLTGVPTTGPRVPRIYYKLSTSGGWSFQSGTLSSGTGTNGVWSFPILAADLGALAVGNTIQYYVIAEDIVSTANVGSNPAGVVATHVDVITTHPSAPNTYTINGFLSGTHNVGVGQTYVTLADAISAYNNSCLAGPVVFQLMDATYTTTSQLTINANPFANSTNTLTIVPASGITTIINGTVPSGAVFKILGSYVVINGSNNGSTSRNLTINNLSATTPNVIVIGSTGTTPVTNVTVKNSTIVNGVATSSAIIVSDAAAPGTVGYFNNITLDNNSIQKAYIGIYSIAVTANGNGSIIMSNNTLNATAANAIRLVGLYTQGTDGAVITNNTISNLESTTAETDYGIWLATDAKNAIVSGNTITALGSNTTPVGTPRGITVSSGVANANIKISGNTISGLTTSGTGQPHGISLSGVTSGVTISENKVSNIKNTNTGGWGAEGIMLASTSTTANVLIANNFVSDVAAYGFIGGGSSDNGYGIFVSSGTGYRIHHNTVLMNTNQTVAGWPAAINISSSVTGNMAVDLRNNILVNTQTVGTERYAIYSGNPVGDNSALRLSHNNLYTAGPNVAYMTGANQVDIAAIDALYGASLSQLSILPVFASATDLHLSPASSNTTLDNKGIPITEVSTDIDAEMRSDVSPDMGADEFGSVCFSTQITTQPLTQAVCVGSNLTLSVVATGSGLTYQWQKDGVNVPSNGTSANYTITGVTAADAGSYRVVISSTCVANVTSSAAVITTSTTAAISSQPSAQVVCPGATANFSVTATNAVTYQWMKDGVALAGETASTLTINNAAAANTGVYTVLITSSAPCASVTSVGASLSLNPVTAITQQPQPQTACAGGPVTFTVTADGVGLTYQWLKDGVAIPVATSASYTIPATVAADAGSYSVTVTGTCGAPVTSSAALLTLNTPPAINTQPVTQTVCTGNNLTLSVGASGTGLTYQWRKNGINIPGETNPAYTITGLAPSDAGDYDVVINSACGTTSTSNIATITVNTTTVVNTAPVGQTLCAGDNYTLSVGATGTGITYQWRRNGVAITGAASATYAITNATTANAGSYDVVVTGSCNAITTTPVSIVVNVPAAIATQPTNQATCTGSATTFSVSATGTGLTYQWLFNGAAISGATNPTYTISNTVAANAGNYSVTVTANCGAAVTSNSVSLTVNVITAINTQPATQVACAGTAATFTVGAAGSNLTYQWRKNGAAIAGATNATYSIASVVSADAGNYDVVVTGTCGTVTSATAALVVTQPPVIISQPTNQAACTGGSATFSVGATGTGLTYQWFFGTTAIAGANAASYTINPVAAASAGAYSVRITGICGTPINSISVNLTLNTPVAITTQPVSQNICANSNVTFSVTATGTGLTYQWRRNGVAIAGATSATYTITNAGAAAAGDYTVVVTGTCNSVTSNIATLVTNPAIQLTGFTGSSTVCTGSTATYSVTATSTGALTYQWRKNGVAIAGATSSTYTIASAAATDAGNYDVVISGLGSCSFTTNAITLAVNASCVTAVPTLNADVTTVVLMPNVVRHNATLKVSVRRSMKIDWNVTDANGRVVLRFNQQVAAGQNNLFNLQTAKLASGTYHLTGFTANGKTTTVRFIKL